MVATRFDFKAAEDGGTLAVYEVKGPEGFPSFHWHRAHSFMNGLEPMAF